MTAVITIYDLPQEIISHILSFLNIEELINLGPINKNFTYLQRELIFKHKSKKAITWLDNFSYNLVSYNNTLITPNPLSYLNPTTLLKTNITPNTKLNIISYYIYKLNKYPDIAKYYLKLYKSIPYFKYTILAMKLKSLIKNDCITEIKSIFDQLKVEAPKNKLHSYRNIFVQIDPKYTKELGLILLEIQLNRCMLNIYRRAHIESFPNWLKEIFNNKDIGFILKKILTYDFYTDKYLIFMLFFAKTFEKHLTIKQIEKIFVAIYIKRKPVNIREQVRHIRLIFESMPKIILGDMFYNEIFPSTSSILDDISTLTNPYYNKIPYSKLLLISKTILSKPDEILNIIPFLFEKSTSNNVFNDIYNLMMKMFITYYVNDTDCITLLKIIPSLADNIFNYEFKELISRISIIQDINSNPKSANHFFLFASLFDIPICRFNTHLSIGFNLIIKIDMLIDNAKYQRPSKYDILKQDEIIKNINLSTNYKLEIIFNFINKYNTIFDEPLLFLKICFGNDACIIKMLPFILDRLNIIGNNEIKNNLIELIINIVPLCKFDPIKTTNMLLKHSSREQKLKFITNILKRNQALNSNNFKIIERLIYEDPIIKQKHITNAITKYLSTVYNYDLYIEFKDNKPSKWTKFFIQQLSTEDISLLVAMRYNLFVSNNYKVFNKAVYELAIISPYVPDHLIQDIYNSIVKLLQRCNEELGLKNYSILEIFKKTNLSKIKKFHIEDIIPIIKSEIKQRKVLGIKLAGIIMPYTSTKEKFILLQTIIQLLDNKYSYNNLHIIDILIQNYKCIIKLINNKKLSTSLKYIKHNYMKTAVKSNNPDNKLLILLDLFNEYNPNKILIQELNDSPIVKLTAP